MWRPVATYSRLWHSLSCLIIRPWEMVLSGVEFWSFTLVISRGSSLWWEPAEHCQCTQCQLNGGNRRNTLLSWLLIDLTPNFEVVDILCLLYWPIMLLLCIPLILLGLALLGEAAEPVWLGWASVIPRLQSRNFLDLSNTTVSQQACCSWSSIHDTQEKAGCMLRAAALQCPRLQGYTQAFHAYKWCTKSTTAGLVKV